MFTQSEKLTINAYNSTMNVVYFHRNVWKGVIVNRLSRLDNKDKILMKRQFDGNLWLTYQKTWFKMPKLPNYNNNFCIVTAFNPQGNPQSSTQNICQNRELAHELSLSKLKYYAIRAGNADFSYFEDSFIVECSKLQALCLGRKWQQNAVFWVDSSQLYLLACQPLIIQHKTITQTHIGDFTQRVLLSQLAGSDN